MPEKLETAHGGDLYTYRERYGSNLPLDFSANINPLGMPESVRAALAASAGHSIHYPDPFCRDLREALGRWEGVPPVNILCGNGAADLIYRIAYALCPKTALLPVPTFGEYEQALSRVGCRCTHYRLQKEHSFQLQPDFLKQIDGKDVVFLCNPNNPTGLLLEKAFLLRVLEKCRETGAALVIDECFLDFTVDGYSLKNHLGEYGRLIVLKAFTKIFAMPGIRLGYCLCGDGELLGHINNAGAPWSVSVPAQLCGIAATGERAFVEESKAVVTEQRQYLLQGLQRLGFTVYSGTANYLFFHSKEKELTKKLAKKGVMLRNCANFQGLSPGYYRTAVRLHQDNDALLEALGEQL